MQATNTSICSNILVDLSVADKEYGGLIKFIKGVSEPIKGQLVDFLYPLYVYFYLILIKEGKISDAEKFLSIYSEPFLNSRGYDNVLKDLFSLKTLQEVKNHSYFKKFCESNYVVRVSVDSLKFLKKYLQEAEYRIIPLILNQQFHIEVIRDNSEIELVNLVESSPDKKLDNKSLEKVDNIKKCNLVDDSQKESLQTISQEQLSNELTKKLKKSQNISLQIATIKEDGSKLEGVSKSLKRCISIDDSQKELPKTVPQEELSNALKKNVKSSQKVSVEIHAIKEGSESEGASNNFKRCILKDDSENKLPKTVPQEEINNKLRKSSRKVSLRNVTIKEDGSKVEGASKNLKRCILNDDLQNELLKTALQEELSNKSNKKLRSSKRVSLKIIASKEQCNESERASKTLKRSTLNDDSQKKSSIKPMKKPKTSRKNATSKGEGYESEGTSKNFITTLSEDGSPKELLQTISEKVSSNQSRKKRKISKKVSLKGTKPKESSCAPDEILKNFQKSQQDDSPKDFSAHFDNLKNSLKDDAKKLSDKSQRKLSNFLYLINSGKENLSSVDINKENSLLACGLENSEIHVWDFGIDSSKQKDCNGNVSRTFNLNRSNECLLLGSNENEEPSIGISNVLKGHDGPVFGLAFAPSNNLLLSCSEDSIVRGWSTQDFKSKSVYYGHKMPIWDVTVNFNDTQFATGSMDGTARLWDFERRSSSRVFTGHSSGVDCVRFHPNGMYIASSSNKAIQLWTVQDARSVRTFSGNDSSINCLAFAPNGQYLASSDEAGCIKIWDLGSGQQLTEIETGSTSIVNISYNKSGSLLASGERDNSIKIWDMNCFSSQNNLMKENQNTDKFRMSAPIDYFSIDFMLQSISFQGEDAMTSVVTSR